MVNTILAIELTALALCIGIFLGIFICIGGGVININKKERPQSEDYSSKTAFTRVWHIEMINLNTGEKASKDFSNQIVLGRGRIPGSLFWQLCVGEDSTISREQCVIYDYEGLLVLENRSSVNITELDGTAVYKPYEIREGDELTFGKNSYYISSLSRIA